MKLEYVSDGVRSGRPKKSKRKDGDPSDGNANDEAMNIGQGWPQDLNQA